MFVASLPFAKASSRKDKWTHYTNFHFNHIIDSLKWIMDIEIRIGSGTLAAGLYSNW
jgi:hypothetical protein